MPGVLRSSEVSPNFPREVKQGKINACILIILLGLSLFQEVIFPGIKLFVVLLKHDSHGLKHLMKNGCWCKTLLFIYWGNPLSYAAFASASPDDPEKFQQVFFKQNFSQDGTYSFHVQSQASVGSYRLSRPNTSWNLSLGFFNYLSACICNNLDNHMKIILRLF